MANPVFITRSASTLRGIRKTTLSQRVSAGETSLFLILVVLISLVLLLYLVHSNQSATKGYEIRILDNEYDDLSHLSEVWNMRNAEARSMQTILGSEVIRHMVEVDDPIYLTKENI